jgi:hypothetical protein
MIVVVIKREAADGAASFLGVSCLASETAGTERNAAAEPQTEARRSSGLRRMPARDEGAFGRRGRRSEMKRSPVRRPERALVTATRQVVPGGEINALTQDVRHK